MLKDRFFLVGNNIVDSSNNTVVPSLDNADTVELLNELNRLRVFQHAVYHAGKTIFLKDSPTQEESNGQANNTTPV